ncbi:hypothetical protein KA107_02585 [Candidatus Pacearchaeota archaeon]|nr:hypothetical protein [Candidatus Pacearchaeota archaeon]
MAEEKQIYVSFDKPEYKTNKAILLKCQIDLVNLQKKMNQLKAIRGNKKRHLAQLEKNFSNMNDVLERLTSKMPEAGLPKHLKIKVKEKKDVVERAPKEKTTKEKKEDAVDSLDRELLDIQRRLKELE